VKPRKLPGEVREGHRRGGGGKKEKKSKDLDLGGEVMIGLSEKEGFQTSKKGSRTPKRIREVEKGFRGKKIRFENLITIKSRGDASPNSGLRGKMSTPQSESSRDERRREGVKRLLSKKKKLANRELWRSWESGGRENQ